ncbi:hypothetical protein ACIF70_08910 [Actinacidiphila glaucinigra]
MGDAGVRLVFRATGDLPRIGLAAMRAEGFVTLALPAWASRRLW